MENKNELFAGINGVSGYTPLLEYILSPMRRVFIIKGSSGCGKSTIMKRIAARAEAKGMNVVRIRCSSDPDSLDGVMIPDIGVGLADGTPPHTIEPKKYGFREQTVSLENSFDYDRLNFFESKLTRLLEKKASYSRTASACIAAFGEAEEARREYTAPALLEDKLDAFCRNFTKRHCRTGSSNVAITPTDTFCRRGFITAGALPDDENTYVLHDRYGASETVLTALYSYGKACGADMALIPCPIDINRLSGIYYPSSGVLIRSNRFTPLENGKSIRVSRFLDSEKVSLCKSRLSAVAKLEEGLLEEAREAMRLAFEVHGEVEKIYSQCVDFSVTDDITKNLSERIFEE